MKSTLLVQYDMKIKTDTIIILVYPSVTFAACCQWRANCQLQTGSMGKQLDRLLPMVT